ncbi:unnamed protein product [Brugia timori]|uniref:non-specific serine/threonine protein kinase n=1 Tax=Brugia timori TaxID=42155 RepID=A0A0R3R0M2_9BILA|nr:unnamed protein product [Brugia timori]
MKIADFGISYEFQGIDAFLCGTAGTPAFMAPEALTGLLDIKAKMPFLACNDYSAHFFLYLWMKDSSCFYSGRAQDIWSLGVTLYAFVYGVVPFWDSSIISKSLKLLILNLLKKDPGLRLMLNEIKEHNWVTQNGRYPMPSETTNCELITVTNEEIQNCVRNIPHLDTLILIKFMVHRRRFGNPFKIMRKTSECNSLLTTNRHNEKIIKSDISNIFHPIRVTAILISKNVLENKSNQKSMDVLNAKTKNLLLNAGTIKANRSESVDKKISFNLISEYQIRSSVLRINNNSISQNEVKQNVKKKYGIIASTE